MTVSLNKKVPATIVNLPFLHIERINGRDGTTFGGLKKAIRLAKNVKNDAENESVAAQLPSFDIAALLYYADQNALRMGYSYELAILRETQRFFDWCYQNQPTAKQLRTPDGSRIILDTIEKVQGLTAISLELDRLATEVAKEQLGPFVVDPTWASIDQVLKSTVVPIAA